MARSQVTEIVTDPISDSGAVLWSIVRGEQLEFPVTLNFLTNAFGYTYEAVIVEADNVSGEDTVPTTVKPSGVESTLVVRVPEETGAWSAVAPYDREDVVSYSGLYYKLKTGTGYVNATPPSSDSNWELYVPNKVYIQFPKELTVSPAYSVLPTANASVYGFFELRVTEPVGGVYQRTWKPMRGVVEFLFSPTEEVP